MPTTKATTTTQLVTYTTQQNTVLDYTQSYTRISPHEPQTIVLWFI